MERITKKRNHPSAFVLLSAPVFLAARGFLVAFVLRDDPAFLSSLDLWFLSLWLLLVIYAPVFLIANNYSAQIPRCMERARNARKIPLCRLPAVCGLNPESLLNSQLIMKAPVNQI